MPKQCELTGKRARAGRNVAHSNRVTNRRFDPNLQRVSLVSDVLGCHVPLRICTRAIRSVQKHGGLDSYLLATADLKLPETGLRLKRRVQRAMSKGRKNL